MRREDQVGLQGKLNGGKNISRQENLEQQVDRRKTASSTHYMAV